MTRCVVLLGPPGAGKSTQGEMLAAHFGLRRIASGELLHQEVRDDTARGRAARRYMAAGELVPDDLLVDIVTAAIAAVPDVGVILDGFPRTSVQACLAEDVLRRLSWRVDAALEFAVDTATIRTRLADRRAAHARFDDDPEVVERRLRAGRPPVDLLDHYRNRGLLHVIDATRPRATVSAAVLRAVTSAATQDVVLHES